MVIKNVTTKVLEYLKKQGQANTFRLSTVLGIDRVRILNIVKELEKKQAVKVESGVVRFLKIPVKEKKAKKTVKKAPKAERKVKRKIIAKRKPGLLEAIKAENKRLKEKLLELQNATPKIIRRIKIKKIIQRVPVKPRKLEEQAERVKELEETVKELQKKLSAKPKVIRRTIVKEVPKIIRKTIIKKIPVKIKEKIPKPPKLSKKFKLPKIQLKKPEFLKAKINIRKPKFDFSKLAKGFKQVHVPEIIKKGR